MDSTEMFLFATSSTTLEYRAQGMMHLKGICFTGLSILYWAFVDMKHQSSFQSAFRSLHFNSAATKSGIWNLVVRDSASTAEQQSKFLLRYSPLILGGPRPFWALTSIGFGV